jgi:hypothetical protein
MEVKCFSVYLVPEGSQRLEKNVSAFFELLNLTRDETGEDRIRIFDMIAGDPPVRYEMSLRLIREIVGPEGWGGWGVALHSPAFSTFYSGKTHAKEKSRLHQSVQKNRCRKPERYSRVRRVP